jgi:MinD-like ATPase involved in chromosome partitioning or flagellar assembly
LILLEEPHAWVAAATLARLGGPSAVETLIAPVPGLAFLSARGREGEELNEWWERMATAPGRPIVITAHEDDLPRWVPGLDADFVIAVPDEGTLNLYSHLPNVLASVDDDPRRLAELALRGPTGTISNPPDVGYGSEMREVRGKGWEAEGPLLGRREGQRLGERESPTVHHLSQRDQGGGRGSGRGDGAERRLYERTTEPPHRGYQREAREVEGPPSASPQRSFSEGSGSNSRIPDPFELLGRAGPIESGKPPGGTPSPSSYRDRGPTPRRPFLDDPQPRSERAQTRVGPDQPRNRLGQRRQELVGAELGQAVLACKPLLAAVVSRKGGVGKTASAAAVAAILGEAVDCFGHTAALVDANLGDPEAWNRLEVRGKVTTMRDLVRSLMAGIEPPSPAYAETPALAIYPESRDAVDGYAPAQIHRVASYLRSRHAVIVVDLPNRLPAFTSAEAAAAAAWIGEADVLVLPTTPDPTTLVGAVEYLDSDSVQGKPVVVPYIVPRIRQIREAPPVRQLLERIREVVTAVVEVPDDDRATLALIKHTTATEGSNELRQAYVDLATHVVEAAASRRDRWAMR